MSAESFNPRARAGRDTGALRRSLKRSCFNPRARAGRDFPHQHFVLAHDVSIHAPARGATALHAGHRFWTLVSIHAPARGATNNILHERHINGFQSTRPRGARLIKNSLNSFSLALFQSTRPRGARLSFSGAVLEGFLFQSTRPRGARLLSYN